METLAEGFQIRPLAQTKAFAPFVGEEVDPGTPDVILSFYLPSSTGTRYNNQSQEKDSFHEFLFYNARWLRWGFDP